MQLLSRKGRGPSGPFASVVQKKLVTPKKVKKKTFKIRIKKVRKILV